MGMRSPRWIGSSSCAPTMGKDQIIVRMLMERRLNLSGRGDKDVPFNRQSAMGKGLLRQYLS
jgi:hypothetical protein